MHQTALRMASTRDYPASHGSRGKSINHKDIGGNFGPE
jgi:hypothetical protein